MPVFEKVKSKIKMVALMPPKEQNITWYSPITQNNKSSEKIVNGMLKRFQNQDAAKRVQVIQFYEDGVKIHEIKV